MSVTLTKYSLNYLRILMYISHLKPLQVLNGHQVNTVIHKLTTHITLILSHIV